MNCLILISHIHCLSDFKLNKENVLPHNYHRFLFLQQHSVGVRRQQGFLYLHKHDGHNLWCDSSKTLFATKMKFMLKKTLKININKYFVRQRSYPLVHILQSQMQDFRLSDDLYHESDSSISSAEFLPNNTIPFLHNLRSENTDI